MSSSPAKGVPASGPAKGGGLIGESLPRLEDEPLLRGTARFVDDIEMADALEACFVRSQFAHARVRGVDAAAALALPGVHAVLTLAELRPHLEQERMAVGLPSKAYRQHRDRPALCAGEAVYVGEPVAVVIADDRYLAEDGAEQVVVDCEPLPAASDCREALAADAPPVHADADDNLLAEFETAYGDVDAAFAGAPHVFEEQLWQHRGGGHSMECRGVLARHDRSSDELTLWTSNQMPHAALRVLVDMLGREESRLRVIAPDVGGGFGPKLVTYQEEVVVALAAQILGRPVKWIEDRREHFAAATQERDQYWNIAIAVDGQGVIQGVRGDIIHDHGAYTARGINLPQNSAESLPGSYRVPAYRVGVRIALTNRVPVTPVRGAGHPQGTFAMERLLDRVARELDIDRAEVRRRNLIPASAMPYRKDVRSRDGAPVVLDSGDYPATQALALERADWSGFAERQHAAREQGRHLGIGLANFVKGTGRGPFEEVIVRIGTSGRITVLSGAVPIGQGTRTMLTQVVASRLGNDPDNITVRLGDTRDNALGIGTSNSRVAVTAGTSAHVAATRVREKVLAVAATLLDVAPDTLDIVGDEVCVKPSGGQIPNASVTLAEVAKAVDGTPGYHLPGGMAPGLEAVERVVLNDKPYAHGCAVAEVEVDPGTGGVSIVRYTVVHDCGRRINPMLVEGQVVGATAHGIGNSLFEYMRYDENGQPVTTTLADYLLVSASEMPRIDVIHTETATDLNPLGVKGVGECATIPVPAAVIGAVEDALSPFGVVLRRCPVFPPDILAAIHGDPLLTLNGRGSQ